MKRTLITAAQIVVTIAILIWVFHEPSKRAQMGEALRNANVSPGTFTDIYCKPQGSVAEEVDNEHLLELLPSLAIQRASYTPPKAAYFSDLQILSEAHRVTRKSSASALIDHPEGAIVEYPEAGRKNGEAVAHRFTIDPTRVLHPKSNIQYSLGDKHGGQENVTCLMLLDSMSGKAIECKKRTYGCK